MILAEDAVGKVLRRGAARRGAGEEVLCHSALAFVRKFDFTAHSPIDEVALALGPAVQRLRRMGPILPGPGNSSGKDVRLSSLPRPTIPQ